MPGQQQSEMSLRDKSNVALTVLLAFGRTVWMLTAVPGTVGHRQAASPAAVWALGLTAAFAALGRSEVLWWWLAVAVFCQALHRARSRRAAGLHTWSMGESQLARAVGPSRARGAEALLTLAAALGLSEADPAAAVYFLLAAFGHAMTVWYTQAKADAVDDDLSDGMLEMEQRAGAGPVVRKPWDLN